MEIKELMLNFTGKNRGARLKDICNFLDEELRIKDIEDTSKNGLQIEGKEEVRRVLLAVDASLQTFQEAERKQCELVVVHHGLFWRDTPLLTGILLKRVRVLIKNEISLYSAHLPLDLHPQFGNNALLIQLFPIEKREKFGYYHGEEIGYIGKLKAEKRLSEVVDELENKLNTKCKLLPFGREKVQCIATVSGRGADLIGEAIIKGADLFITGEPKLEAYYLAKEGRINLIFAGHYATEVLGIKGLGEVLKSKFNIKCNFFDLQTEL
jgi:dinuclear metal center YbgI/SA1388 family protein